MWQLVWALLSRPRGARDIWGVQIVSPLIKRVRKTGSAMLCREQSLDQIWARLGQVGAGQLGHLSSDRNRYCIRA